MVHLRRGAECHESLVRLLRGRSLGGIRTHAVRPCFAEGDVNPRRPVPTVVLAEESVDISLLLFAIEFLCDCRISATSNQMSEVLE
jgi:hypothetical protein